MGSRKGKILPKGRKPGRVSEAAARRIKPRVYVFRFRIAPGATSPNTGTDVKLVGFAHGALLRPLPAHTKHLLKKEMGKDRGPILAESMSPGFLPKGLSKRGIRLRSGRAVEQHLFSQRRGKNAKLSDLKIIPSELFKGAKEYVRRTERMEGLPPRAILQNSDFETREMREYLEDMGMTPRQYYHRYQLITPIRSVLMASDVMEYMKAHPEIPSVSVMVGRDHMAEVHGFLTRPALARRYINFVCRRLERQGALPWLQDLLIQRKEQFAES